MAKHGHYSHIEIPADDLERATTFYKNVFGWHFDQMPGFEDYHVYSGEHAGVGGGMGKRGVTAGHVVRNYINVDSIDAAIPKVTAHGGRITQPKAHIPGQGWYAVIEDSEGNEIALWEQSA
jgi:predicted enzyme related to lactoylglutathione lyase